MKNVLVSLLFTALAFYAIRAIAAPAWPADRPKVVIVIVIDQFRADYLTRFDSRFGPDGFKALIKDGAYYPFGEYNILQSMTGPGHATVLTGAYPYQMGIPLNDWYDQKKSAPRNCVEDETYSTVGIASGNHPSVSPRSLVGTTVGDELKNADFKSYTLALALKDRAAVLLGGHRADLAFWYDGAAKQWVSSNYYVKDAKLPGWLEAINSRIAAAPGVRTVPCDLSTPCGVDLTVEAFKAAVRAEVQGHAGRINLIAVSFSSHDIAGHKYGPNSKEMEAMTLAEDAAIASIRKSVAEAVPGGLRDVLFILTGDHGVAPTPQYLAGSGIEAGRIDEPDLARKMETVFTRQCGAPAAGKKWIGFFEDFNFFLDNQVVSHSKCDHAKAENLIRDVLLRQPVFAHVLTRTDFLNRRLPPGQFARHIENTYYDGRSGDVIGMQNRSLSTLQKISPTI
jgi:hypothetical protein